MDHLTWERAQHYLEQARSHLPGITSRLEALSQVVHGYQSGEDVSPEEQEELRREAESVRYQVLYLSGSLSSFTQALTPPILPKGP